MLAHVLGRDARPEDVGRIHVYLLRLVRLPMGFVLGQTTWSRILTRVLTNHGP